MRWKKALCVAFACAAAVVVVLGQNEEEQEGIRGLVRAAAAPAAPAAASGGGGNQGHASGGEHQQQQQQQQAHGNANSGKGAQSPDSGKDNKTGKGAAKANDSHDAGQHDKQQTNSKDGHRGSDGNSKKDAATPSSSDKNKDKDKDKEDKKPSKTRKLSEDDDDEDEGDSEAEKEYLKRVKADKDAGKLPGRMKMVVPPRTVHTPLFELDSVVELKWEYDNNVIEVPEKLMISVQLPKDPHDSSAKPVIYDIATNVTGKKKSFFWDTKNDVPEGVGMREGSGYTMFFYDGDIGFRMSDVVPAGYLIKYAMPFAFYISRYERTNDGVPRNYNPNDGMRQTPSLALTATLLLAVSMVVHVWGA